MEIGVWDVLGSYCFSPSKHHYFLKILCTVLVITFDSCHVSRWDLVHWLVEREYYNFDSGENNFNGFITGLQ